MKIDIPRLLGPLTAALVLVLVLQQTIGALRVGGVWGRARASGTPEASPFARIEGLLASSRVESVVPARDPFAFGRPATPVAVRRPAAPRPAPEPVAPPAPVLTAIVWLEDNPSATIRWNGRDYPVQVNTLFDEFRVLSITRSQVTLTRGGETLVLELPKKGD